MRIGHGYDVHRFCTGSFIVIGGVKILHKRGLLAHSDGDVLIHAICDSILGALGLGDIGQHFPDDSPQYMNIDSRILLRKVCSFIKLNKRTIANIDSTIIAQSPKMLPYIDQMKNNLAKDLDLTIDQVNIKATTTENLGYIGRREGIAAHAVTLLL